VAPYRLPPRVQSRRRVTGGSRFPLLPLLLLAAIAAAVWWWPDDKAESASASTPARVPVPIAGTRTLASPLAVDVVIDESQSTDSTDPTGLRHSEAEAIVTWMNRYSENAADRFGAIEFAGKARSVPPEQVSHATAALTKLFREPMAALGSGTDLVPAARLVERDLKPLRNTRRVVIVLSDGQLNDMSTVPAVVRRLRSAADSVYVVGLNGDGTWARETRHSWAGLGLTGLFKLDQVRKNRLAQTVANIVIRETGQQVELRPAARS
jgi:von Willebrand factor type A domain